MKDLNAERLEAMEWAMREGFLLGQRHGHGFSALTGIDEDRTFAWGESLPTLADQLVRIRERMEARP